jgi:hypothetical protein
LPVRYHPFAGGKEKNMEAMIHAPYIPVLKSTSALVAVLAFAAIRSPIGWNIVATALERLAALMRQRE